MPEDIHSVEFTVFDTETTGLDPACGDRIVEIAAIKFKNNMRGETFHSLVYPQRRISPAAFQINNISDDMLKEAPSIEKVLPAFLEFIKGSVLCSYNAGFDMDFISNEARLSNLSLPQELIVVDILTMARKLLPGLQRHALWFVASQMGINTVQQHRAFSDVELTIEVFGKLNAMLKSKGITEFSQFRGLFSLASPYSRGMDDKKIQEIQQAIDLEAKLKIKYFSHSEARVTERLVTPREIIQNRNRGYLVGYCHLRSEERTFRIDGILHIEIV